VREHRLHWAALAATAITPAFAQDVPTVIYGTLNVDFERVEATDAGAPRTLPAGSLGFNPTGINVPARNRVTQNSSNLGFKGGERLGPGLSVFWQVESGVAVDSGGSAIASRNTAIGLQGTFGSLRLGQWDTPFKTLSGAVDPMYFTGITYTGAIIGTPGFGVGPVTIGGIAVSGDGRTYAGSANASFERRQGNIVQYWLPPIGGVTTRFAYSVNEGRRSTRGRSNTRRAFSTLRTRTSCTRTTSASMPWFPQRRRHRSRRRSHPRHPRATRDTSSSRE